MRKKTTLPAKAKKENNQNGKKYHKINPQPFLYPVYGNRPNTE